MLQLATAFLVVSGAIYLFSVFWVVGIPGALIWLGWISLARGYDTFHHWLFWGASLVWNAGMAMFFIGDHFDGNLFILLTPPVLHSLIASIVSLGAIWHSLTYDREAVAVSHQPDGGSPGTRPVDRLD